MRGRTRSAQHLWQVQSAQHQPRGWLAGWWFAADTEACGGYFSDHKAQQRGSMLVALHTPVLSFTKETNVKVVRPDAGIKETLSVVPLPCTCKLQMQEAMLRRELSIMTERLSRAQSEAVQLRAEREDMYLQLKDIEAALASGRGGCGGPGGLLVPGARCEGRRSVTDKAPALRIYGTALSTGGRTCLLSLTEESQQGRLGWYKGQAKLWMLQR